MTLDQDSNGPRGGFPGAGLFARLDCRELGIAPPPVQLHMKWLRLWNGWVAVIRSDSGDLGEVVAWIAAFKPHAVEQDPNGGRILHARFAELPPPFAELLAGLRFLLLRISPTGEILAPSRNGSAVPRPLERVAAPAVAPGEGDGVRHTNDAPPAVRLTSRQDELLREAARLGYYDVPRRVHLRQIAARFGSGVASAAEVLRRAEGRLVGDYVRHPPARDGDARRPRPRKNQKRGPD